MKISDYLLREELSLSAGGPGSGRHPGGGKLDFHKQILEKNGFKKEAESSVDVANGLEPSLLYTHKDNSKEHVMVSKDGSWRHIKRGGVALDKNGDFGTYGIHDDKRYRTSRLRGKLTSGGSAGKDAEELMNHMDGNKFV